MQAEFVQCEKSVKAECIFYFDVIQHQKGVSKDDVNVENALSLKSLQFSALI